MLTEDSLRRKVAAEAVKAVSLLPPPLEKKISQARENSEGLERKVLGRILENIEAAESSGVPLCQDTGVFEVWLRLGKNTASEGRRITEAILRGVRDVHESGPLRSSMSDIKPVIHTEISGADETGVIMTPRGFGSENYTFLHMLPPGVEEDEIIERVYGDLRRAAGRPCPPYVLGLGIGGTASKAVELSALALAECDFEHSPFEERVLRKANTLGTGAGGVGGAHTVLGVKLLEFPRHIAGVPLAVHIGCWCNRVVRFFL